MVERILFHPGGATELKQDAIISALQNPVALDGPTIAALKQVQAAIAAGSVVGLDAATLAALEQITVSGTVALDAATLAALENITAVVTGTVALDAPTLAALENITVAIQTGQVVGLDAATLAALEAITVSGTVALDAPTLAALENITAAVTGTVALDAPTLAALESITATVSGSVSVSNFPATYPLPTSQVTALTPQTNALTDAQLRAAAVLVSQLPLSLATDSVRQTLRVSTPLSTSVTGPVTDQVLVAIPTGSRIRLIRNAGHVDPGLDPASYPIVTLKIGTTVIYRDKLEAGLPWSETVCFEGADGDDLTISIDIPATIYLNIRYEVF